MIRRIGQWYVTSDAPQDLLALLELDLRPTCLDAAAMHRLWLPPRDDGVHVFRPRQGRRRRTGDTASGRPAAAKGVVPIRRRDREEVPAASGSHGPGASRLVHHGPALRSWPDLNPVPDLDLVLGHAGRCLPSAEAAMLFESALEKRRITMAQAERIVASLPAYPRRSLSRLRSDAGSGTETAVRWWFEARRIPIRSQVWYPEIGGRVDLQVGPRWVIECDSRRFHDQETQYLRDRARDLRLHALGMHVTRLAWEQVFVTWPDTELMLLEMLRRGLHRRER